MYVLALIHISIFITLVFFWAENEEDLLQVPTLLGHDFRQ